MLQRSETWLTGFGGDWWLRSSHKEDVHNCGSMVAWTVGVCLEDIRGDVNVVCACEI